MINQRRQGFTLAEALITLVVMSLILAATMPIVRTASNQPAEAPWKYIVRGNLINNNAVYTASENNALAVAGDNKIPYDDGISEGDLPTIFASQINPKISIVTQPAKSSNPVISRHLLDFYEKNGTNKHKSIGKISFDRNFNLAIGTNALDTTVRDATANVAAPTDANGWYKLGANAKGAANTAVGQYSMGGTDRLILKDTAGSYRILEGTENSSLGAFSLQHISTGSYNVALGSYAMQFSRSGDANVAIGSSSMGKADGTGNVAIGVNALLGSNTVSTAGNTLGKVQGNVAIGYNALRAAHNEYTGSTTNTNGSYNVSIGANTMALIASGKENVAIGNNAMKNYGAESSSNVVIGGGNAGSTSSNKCTHNTVLGYSAMPAITNGTSNVGIGFASLYSTTSGYNNIAIGNSSLQSNTTGIGNIAIGSSVGATGNGNNKLYIGGFVNGNAVQHTGTNALLYGDMANRTLDVNGRLTINGEAYIKNSSGVSSKIVTYDDLTRLTYTVYGMTGHLSVPAPAGLFSDIRLKNVSGDNTAGLKEISQLKVKNFTYKNDKKKTPHVGVIAQDLQKVFPNSVFQDGLSKYLKISREEIFWACVNAIKELNEKVQDIVAKIAGLDEKIKILESKNKMYEEKITNLEHKNKLYEERLQAIEFQIAKQLESSSKVQNKLEDVKAE